MDEMQNFALKEKEKIEERFKKSLGNKKKDLNEIKLDKRKDLELEKIRYLNDNVNTSLKKITKQFPKLKKLDEIYIKLINTNDIKLKDIEESLSKIMLICSMTDNLTQKTLFKIKKAKSQETIGFLMKKHLGKINSFFSKNKEHFDKLEKTRVFINQMPTFLEMYTAAIGGFPNVGKSTLMNKITNSKVEIQNYPFTTKGLMFGYITQGSKRNIQLIDTPGLLNRDKTNNIEKRAQIVLTSYSDIIVFVLDFTQTCGFGIKNQFKLLQETKELNEQKKILVYLSKTDLYDEETEELKEEYRLKLKKYPVFTDYKELKEEIIAQKDKNKKFNIKDINVIK